MSKRELIRQAQEALIDEHRKVVSEFSGDIWSHWAVRNWADWDDTDHDYERRADCDVCRLIDQLDVIRNG